MALAPNLFGQRRLTFILFSSISFFTLLAAFLGLVQAHSTASPSLTYAESVLSIHHDVLAGKQPHPNSKRDFIDLSSSSPSSLAQPITRHDTLRLQLQAFNTTFFLHLEPNLDLLHPDVNLGPSHAEDSFTVDDLMAFKGVVVQNSEHSDHKWRRTVTMSPLEKRSVEHMLHEEGVLGWARIVVEHDPEYENSLVLRGAFMVDEVTYQVNTRQHYEAQRRAGDVASPPPPSRPLTRRTNTAPLQDLVIFRDSDFYQRYPSNLHRRSEDDDHESHPETSCGTDRLLGQSLFKSSSPLVSRSEHDYYYPPNLTTTIPVDEPNLSQSWPSLLLGRAHSPLEKRQITVKVAGPDPVPEGCPINRLVLYMGVAADCTYVKEYGGVAAARKQIFTDFNIVTGIYESTFNIALGLIALNIMPDVCPPSPVKGEIWNQPCSDNYRIESRLSDFSYWRGQGNRTNDGAGLWHLMTKCNSGAVVGIAWTKALCQMKMREQREKGQVQYATGTGVSSASKTEWLVIAHEIGHGFGAIHDCNQQTCQGGKMIGDCCPMSTTTCDAGAKFIMNPSESTPTQKFSSCSIRTICRSVGGPEGQCLKPPGTRSVQSLGMNICGNGLKEEGEECDCGSPAECAKDPCCDGATCKLKNGSVCDDLSDGCCQGCKFKTAGAVCRPAASGCDIEEVCSGTSAECPKDVRVADTTPCKGTGSYANVTGLQCANGVCTSRDTQCKQQDRPGISRQCGSSSTCELTCNDPSNSPMTCIQIPGVYFIDGSPCGVGGTCEAGKCQFQGGFTSFVNWAKNNLMIVVPIASFVGLLMLCCIWSCCCSGCSSRSRRIHEHPKPTHSLSYGEQFPGYGGSGGAPPPSSQYPPEHYPMHPLPPAPPPTYQEPYGYPPPAPYSSNAGPYSGQQNGQPGRGGYF
ncbi:hypothetical protein BGW38_010939 [Lunasporangiospora selenospora]|uniref:Uncharacterized protein n=1 Tax=Lunasporangiospora selenospora TaxID=979761 RepID=A0A9P6KFB4_9FUNG|nr:hypothetical protein BGW38_010939 [Lunasporangiospora selenospora]